MIIPVYAPSIIITTQYDQYSACHNKGCIATHGVPSGPVIYADMSKESNCYAIAKLTRHLIISTLVSSTRRNTEESHATGRLVVNTASCTSH